MKKYIIGLWKERKDIYQPSFYSYISIEKKHYDGRLIEYITDETNMLFVGNGVTKCLINKEKSVRSELLSDGVWVWATDIYHYIKNHNFILPEIFENHIQKNNYIMPKLTESEKKELRLEVQALVKSLPQGKQVEEWILLKVLC